MSSTEESKQCQQRPLSLASKSKQVICNEYKKCDETTKRELYVFLLNEIEKSILENNIVRLKGLSHLIDIITKQNIAIILNHSQEQSFKANHGIFYYAIRSNKIDLLYELFDKYPEDHFALCPTELDHVLSLVYEELKLKNVPLTEETELFVQSKLINARYFSSSSREKSRSRIDPNSIRKRIECVVENIHLLKEEYSNDKGEDEKFIFVATFIAKNLHILKCLLRSTYDRLPWEEIEYCLISFISTLIKKTEINFYYNVVLDKIRILKHLDYFGEKLSGEKNNLNVHKISVLPSLSREEAVAKIINRGEFLELYNDYRQIREVYCLQQIYENVKLAVASDSKKREGQLIITRVLQIISENLKNTWESPNLSPVTSELLLLSLPKSTRQIIRDFHNSSHTYAFAELIKIEENKQIDIFIGIQNDINKIETLITDFVCNVKLRIIKIILKRFIEADSPGDIKKIAKLFGSADFDKLIVTKGNSSEKVKLKQLTNELNQLTNKLSEFETQFFNKMNTLIIQFIQIEPANITEYTVEVELLKVLNRKFNEDLLNRPNEIRVLKLLAKNISEMFLEIGSPDLKNISNLWIRITQHIKFRLMYDNMHTISLIHSETSIEETIEKLHLLTCQFFYLAECVRPDFKWIEHLQEMFCEKSFLTALNEPTVVHNTRKEQQDKLASTLAELTCIINNYAPSSASCYRKRKDLQAIIEMLVLAVLSILDRSEKRIENTALFLDDNAPLLIGSCLRNHLTYNLTLINILPYDSLITILLNAKKLVSENVKQCKNKIGKLSKDDPYKLKYKYDQNLSIIASQKRMFGALEEGDLEQLKDCLQVGAEIKARNKNLWTALHFAAKGPNLNVVKFVVNQKLSINAKDYDGQIPFHIAAAFGRTIIVEYFLKETDVDVNDRDNFGRTPLILASKNGHESTVELLLFNYADSTLQDLAGYTALTYAVNNMHIEVVKTLLKKENNINAHEASGGFTLLHLAAEKGHRELVNVCLKSGVIANKKSYREETPLHAATLNGHLEIVNYLLLIGLNVNSTNLNGCTPLHYAVKIAHQSITNALLRHGADVNIADKFYNLTPIHRAAQNGHEEIFKTLLNYNAHFNTTTISGFTPMHFAAANGHLTIVDTLLKCGVKIFSADGNKDPLLHCTAKNGHAEVLELLLNAGAAINPLDHEERTPLHIAALKGDKGVAEILVKHGARVTCQDIGGMTPLHLAALNGSTDVTDLLLRNRADVNVVSICGVTPLYIAAAKGHAEVVTLLINSKADVNANNKQHCKPLHIAVDEGHRDVVSILLKNKAEINAINFGTPSPLDMAIISGHADVAETLLANGANVNTNTNKLMPLFLAVLFNDRQIAKLLIQHGADLNRYGAYCLSAACCAGYREVAVILLKYKIAINSKAVLNCTPLHLAAHSGNAQLVSLLLKKGADVNAVGHFKFTPLIFAAQRGHVEVMDVLIAQGAHVNSQSANGFTCLHYAAENGYENVVRVLLDNKARIDIKDCSNRSPLEQAVAGGHIGVVKRLVEYKQTNLNAKGNCDFTLLHIAAQEGHLDITEYLINKGCDINARNHKGTKPIHLAAREGHKRIVEFFLDKGVSVNDAGVPNQTIIFYACMTGKLEVVKFLFEKNADINFRGDAGITPIHIAASFGFIDITRYLLEKGAEYNVVNRFDKAPIRMAKNEGISKLLSLTDELFKAVRCNDPTGVENHIKAGACVNAKNNKGVTSLHYAAWKGYDEIIDILLKNNADPNIVNNTGFSPLHYAVRFSCIKIIKALISRGAVFNAVSNDDKTPLDLAVDTPVKCLLNLIETTFKHINNGNSKIITALEKTDKETIKTIMRAHNRQHQTLMTVAILNDFPKVERLKEISQEGVSTQITKAETLFNRGDYENALNIYKNIFEKRIEIFGANNPATLDVDKDIAKLLYKQGDYQKALLLLGKVYQGQKNVLGLMNKDTLSTRSLSALVLHRQRQDEEALSIFQDVHRKQLEILGPNDSDTLDTEFNMALVLNNLGKYEEALSIYRRHFEQCKLQLGAMHTATMCAENNIAMVLANLGKYEEALKTYKKVYEKKNAILGGIHPDTLRTRYNIAGIYLRQKKISEALKEYEGILRIQKYTLGNHHSGTLDTQYNLANVFFIQGKWNYALEIYKETAVHMRIMYGSRYPCVQDILTKISAIYVKLRFEGSVVTEDFKQWQDDMNLIVSNDTLESIRRILKSETDINGSGYADIVVALLQDGVSITTATDIGNTALHCAVSEDYREIVEMLLQHVKPDKLYDFINARTIINGTTALHIASGNGSLSAVMTLLKHGAIYDFKNKEGKTALDVSKNQQVIDLLELTGKLFKDMEVGGADDNFLNQLKFVRDDEFICIMNARNSSGYTLIDIAVAKKLKNVYDALLTRNATIYKKKF